MKKSLFVTGVIAASLSAFLIIVPYVFLLIPGESSVVDVGTAIIQSAIMLGSSIFFTSVFVLSVIGLYKATKK